MILRSRRATGNWTTSSKPCFLFLALSSLLLFACGCEIAASGSTEEPEPAAAIHEESPAIASVAPVDSGSEAPSAPAAVLEVDSAPEISGDEQAQARDTDSAAETEDDEQISLEEVFNFDEATWRANWNLIEEEMKRCMALRGFEYQVRPPEVVSWTRFDRSQEVEALTAREFAQTMGFGISTSFVIQTVTQDGGDLDPNQAYLRSLEPDAASAWRAAYEGPAAPYQTREAAIAGGGCAVISKESINAARNAVIADLDVGYSEMLDRLSADARVVGLDNQWSACMSRAGFDGAGSLEELSLQFDAAFGAFVLPAVSRAQAAGEVGKLTPEDELSLEELRGQERLAAVQAYDCEDSLREQRGLIRGEYEDDYRDAFGELLEDAVLPTK